MSQLVSVFCAQRALIFLQKAYMDEKAAVIEQLEMASEANDRAVGAHVQVWKTATASMHLRGLLQPVCVSTVVVCLSAGGQPPCGVCPATVPAGSSRGFQAPISTRAGRRASGCQAAAAQQADRAGACRHGACAGRLKLHSLLDRPNRARTDGGAAAAACRPACTRPSSSCN